MSGKNDKSRWRGWAIGGSIFGLLVVCNLASCMSNFMPRQGWDPRNGPVVPHDKFPADCGLCHTGKDWTTIKKDFSFDHQKETGVALVGAHKTATCLMCHNDRGPAQQFSQQGCAGCHTDPHRGNLGHLCADCHQEQSWKPKQPIAQHNRTRFPLVGAHAATACFRCHPGAQVGNFEGADTRCVTCHGADLVKATSPNHVQLNWTDNCQRCHSPIGWKPALFQHPSAFPLTGGHSNLQCSVCHKNNVFTGLSTSCVSCHLSDYQHTTKPNHVTAGFSTNCTECHNTNQWQGAKFNHPAAFPLTGGHAGLDCSACHKGGVFTGLSTSCVSCHLSDFQKAKEPNHVASGFSTTCTECHTTRSWEGAKFNHPSAFPLTNGHAGLACSACHKGGVFTGLSTACVSCHLKDFQNATDPNHVKAGFSTNCTDCHSTKNWGGANFKHPSAFPLTNGHANLTCAACHKNGVFTGLSTDCVSCHLKDFQNTTDPNHQKSGFGTNCASCHTTTSWEGATFKHTAFPLSGPHNVSCSKCHPNASNPQQFICTNCHTQARTTAQHDEVRNFRWVSSACYDCHRNGRAGDDRPRTQAPKTGSGGGSRR